MKKKENFFKWLSVFLGIIALLGFGFSPALGESLLSPEDDIEIDSQDVERDYELNWGTKDEVSYAVVGLEFHGFDAGNDNVRAGTGSNIYCTSGCFLMTGINLPSGAQITYLELSGYDAGSGNVTLYLHRCPDNTNFCSNLASTATTNATGYQFRGVSLNHTVDNFNNSYVFEAVFSGGSNYRLVNARVYYRLQVSPAPGSATFGDVPTNHPFFRYIEAMARSGITSGCGGGDFCPDRDLTRGEMAVFLSKALGLHWPF